MWSFGKAVKSQLCFYLQQLGIKQGKLKLVKLPSPHVRHSSSTANMQRDLQYLPYSLQYFHPPAFTTGGNCGSSRRLVWRFTLYRVSRCCRGMAIVKKEILKVPNREIFDRSEFCEFYTIKSLWEGDVGVKIIFLQLGVNFWP
jgi:hypothetical protein